MNNRKINKVKWKCPGLGSSCKGNFSYEILIDSSNPNFDSVTCPYCGTVSSTKLIIEAAKNYNTAVEEFNKEEKSHHFEVIS